MDIYCFLYEKAKDNAEGYGATMPFSKEIATFRVGKSPKWVMDTEFDAIPEEDVRDAVSLRIINHFPNLSIMSAYDKLNARYLSFDRRLRTRSFLYFLSHHPTSKKNKIKLRRNPKLSDFYAENAAFLRKMDVITAFAAVSLNVSSEIRFFIHKKIVEPIWDSFDKESKNRIRRLFGRETK